MDEIRKQLMEQREQIPGRAEANRQLAARLLPFLSRLDKARPFESIGLYIPTGAEADALIRWTLPAFHGWKLGVPKTKGSAMAFYAPKQLRPGTFGILEPADEWAGNPSFVPDVLIIPMLRFYDGWRMGYGKGFYDRYLQKHPNCIRIGIAYDEQEHPFTPNSWDERLDVILTPTRTLFYSEDVQKLLAEEHKQPESAADPEQSERNPG